MKNRRSAAPPRSSPSQPSSLRNYIVEAKKSLEDRERLLYEAAEKIRHRDAIVPEGTSTRERQGPLLRDDLAKNKEWSTLSEEIGSIYCACAVGERKGRRYFVEAIAHLQDAILVPSGFEILWSLAQNNKGAAHYWHAICLSGWVNRHGHSSVSKSRLSECIPEMELSVFHLEQSLIVRERLSLPQVDQHLWAQTVHNIGKSKATLAWWKRSPELSTEAVRAFEELANFDGEIQGDFPFLSKDLAQAKLILQKLEEAPKLDKSLDSMAPSGGITEESTGTITDEPAAIETDVTLRIDFSEASLGDLIAAFVPEIPQQAIDRLSQIIREAQRKTPADKGDFVDQVNRLMTTLSLRLQVKGEEGLARLTMKEGLIRLAVANRGQQRFVGKEIRVIRVPENYGLQGRRPAKPSP